jgi:anti-anti-sigma factor
VNNFEMATESKGGAAVIKVKGYLSGPGGEGLEKEVGDLLVRGITSLEINFRETSMVNSVGISILIGVIEKVKNAGGTLRFSEVSPVNDEVFRLMGLDRHVTFVEGAGPDRNDCAPSKGGRSQ